VGLAPALIGDPEVLILDEPTIGLDPRQIVEIRSLIKSLAGQRTIILSTHILPEVSMVCEGVVIINHGRIVAQGTPEKLTGELSPVARTQVRVAGPAEAVAAALGRVPGVLRVEQTAEADGVGVFVVESPRDQDVRAEVARLVAEQGWGLLELRPMGMSLEDLFIRVVAGEEPAAGAPGEAG
ncbi:MAG: ABC transporter ATP-binding protein, partial [Candidatus Rokubacteria bacterium]|nr:ABC transporter ATP-binding protein [Candidatus Rokubacteria bacterium]